jgi:protein SCO1
VNGTKRILNYLQLHNVKLKFSLTLLIVVSGLIGMNRWARHSAAAHDLPVYGQLEGIFNFTSQDGTRFTTEQMLGHSWLVSFFFTSCSGPCPLLNAQIAGVLAKEPDIRALSISTDQETDTPQVLKEYGQKFNADPRRWIFATSDHKTISLFGQVILKLPVGDTPDAHSPRIVLIDKSGQIRGWYDSQSPGIREKILHDLDQLEL